MKYLIDTNVLSELQRAGGSERVRERLASLEADSLFVSAITVGELTRGVALLRASKRKRALVSWLSATESSFRDRVLAVDRDVAAVWGTLSARLSKSGQTMGVADGLIAATAMRHGLTLMTRNVKDFEASGVVLLNPWG
ncbi:type II toxin-antitoxin system VapC family toxin [Mucisphaera sp.]|uniref:type II toxin-antitoxin system VapC family toxin n=1 Tax=Mucisphaera sp. TaxID=2913024 RepID=UPI003D0B4F05